MRCSSFILLVSFSFIVIGKSKQLNIATLILARGGSKGIPLKNLRLIGDSSLLARAIMTAREAGLQDVTVSTDHILIAIESIKHGAKIFSRSYITATDFAPSIWGVSEFLDTRPEVNAILLIQATSPFLKAASLREAIKLIDNPIPYDCLFSVTRSHKLRWYKKNSRIIPLNFDLKKRPRRQDWDGEMVEAGAFYITRKPLIEASILQNSKLVNYYSNFFSSIS